MKTFIILLFALSIKTVHAAEPDMKHCMNAIKSKGGAYKLLPFKDSGAVDNVKAATLTKDNKNVHFERTEKGHDILSIEGKEKNKITVYRNNGRITKLVNRIKYLEFQGRTYRDLKSTLTFEYINDVCVPVRDDSYDCVPVNLVIDKDTKEIKSLEKSCEHINLQLKVCKKQWDSPVTFAKDACKNDEMKAAILKFGNFKFEKGLKSKQDAQEMDFCQQMVDHRQACENNPGFKAALFDSRLWTDSKILNQATPAIAR